MCLCVNSANTDIQVIQALSITGNSALIIWDLSLHKRKYKNSEITGYELLVQSGGKQNFHSVSGIDRRAYFLKSLIPCTKYAVQVAAVSHVKRDTFTPVIHFTTLEGNRQSITVD